MLQQLQWEYKIEEQVIPAWAREQVTITVTNYDATLYLEQLKSYKNGTLVKFVKGECYATFVKTDEILFYIETALRQLKKMEDENVRG